MSIWMTANSAATHAPAIGASSGSGPPSPRVPPDALACRNGRLGPLECCLANASDGNPKTRFCAVKWITTSRHRDQPVLDEPLMHLLEFGWGKSQLTSEIVASKFVRNIPSTLFPDVVQVSEFRLIESHSADLSTRQGYDHKVGVDGGIDRSSLCRYRICSCYRRSPSLALASRRIANIAVGFSDGHFDSTTQLL
jgi:hypothetical protein